MPRDHGDYRPSAEAPFGPFRTFALAAAVVGATFVTPTAAQMRDLEAAQDVLGARHTEWEREEANFRAATPAKGVTDSEREEHAEFVAGLRRKFLEQCETVRGLGGEASVAKFPCVRVIAAAPTRPLAPAATVQTDEEKRAAMRARLDTLENAIDEDLLKRQEELRQAAAAPTGGGGAGGGGGAAGGGAQSGGGAANPGAQAGAGAGATGGAVGQRGGTAGSNAGLGGAAVPPSPPSQTVPHDRSGVTDGGAGDDIVARQLRQAAEAETDPVLKEKLWAEYRRYRGGRG